MSEADWRAVLAGRDDLTVWAMAPGAAPEDPQTLPRDALNQLPGPVVAAGLDVAPRPVPCVPLAGTTHVVALPHVAAIPMLRQEHPVALTRGAEVAMAGYLVQAPQFDGVLLVLGQETCWSHISAGEVVSFQTFLTPQLADALKAKPTRLDAAFDAALGETLSRPERLAQHLASTHASGTGQIVAHLIGAEIAAAKPYWLGQRIVVLGADPDPYIRALTAQGATVETASLDEALLGGFHAAWSQATA
ncbi:2-dehydro-3-deoxygalactonokinase [Aestuariivita sp.]|jgi:2-dehydro-3-deoxygalactonokinase|uniref:2-dehydro-3-deoxygalactonokinase n=1 Tax=Aestuariivita sp. TaxID=1872407 RepID=UPI00216BF3FF|nr:2-dehydro-3-deoxygalactonokinase [Aestuariivita sp.]MCE8009771.1 2-dehydro-3-deoxygalactonokinase [Aestuariivita sp.]